MASPLLAVWFQLTGRNDNRKVSRRGRYAAAASAAQASATVFLVMRRMRAPLIVLIVIFAVTVLGLTLIPGQDAEGRPWDMGFFDAFYIMSYTASTIGFGEIPHPFTYNQRMWLTISIYVTVVGWAYAIGSLLALLQDRAFRQALALQHFRRKVARLSEPFLLLAGYGRTGDLLGHWLDKLGRRFVVLDSDADQIDRLELGSYFADVPALVADARDPGHLGVAGLAHPSCEAVVALTDDDETNLAVVMAVALLRPELPVIAHTTSRVLAERMRAFGNPTVVNAFDCFSEHLCIALRAPAAYQLMTWLESGPGAELPPRGEPPVGGAWVVCGYGRLGREITAELRAQGSQVTPIDPRMSADEDTAAVVADGADPDVLIRADIEHAAGFVAGTDSDMTNLSLVAAARRNNPDVYVAARQNRSANAPLFAAMDIDLLLVPADVIAHEVYAQLSTPLLWRFRRELPQLGDAVAADLVDRLTGLCGTGLQSMWKVRFNPEQAPALRDRFAPGPLLLADLLRSPNNRDEPLQAVALIVQRGADCFLAPDGDFALSSDDEVLFAGGNAARRSLDTTLVVDAVSEYVLTGRRVPESWVWRKLTRTAV